MKCPSWTLRWRRAQERRCTIRRFDSSVVGRVPLVHLNGLHREEGMQFHSRLAPEKIDVYRPLSLRCGIARSFRRDGTVTLVSPLSFRSSLCFLVHYFLFFDHILYNSIFYLGSILRGHECIIILDERCCCAAVELTLLVVIIL